MEISFTLKDQWIQFVTFEVINLELILADMEQVDRRLGRLAKQAKSGDKAAKAEQAVLEKVKEGFDQELPARALELDEDELQAIKHLQLLTLKPIYMWLTSVKMI